MSIVPEAKQHRSAIMGQVVNSRVEVRHGATLDEVPGKGSTLGVKLANIYPIQVAEEDSASALIEASLLTLERMKKDIGNICHFVDQKPRPRLGR